VQLSIQARAGERTADETLSLYQWLASEPELRGRLALPQQSSDPERMGSALETVLVTLASGGALTTLIKSLQVWLVQRRSEVILQLSGKDGRSVTVTARGPIDVNEVIHNVAGLLDDNAPGQPRDV